MGTLLVRLSKYVSDTMANGLFAVVLMVGACGVDGAAEVFERSDNPSIPDTTGKFAALQYPLGPQGQTFSGQLSTLFDSLAIVNRLRVERITSSAGYIVVSAPLASVAEGRQLINSMKESGFVDVAYMSRGEFEGKISAGVFDRREIAEQRIALLSASGFGMKLLERTRTEENYWIDFPAAPAGLGTILDEQIMEEVPIDLAALRQAVSALLSEVARQVESADHTPGEVAGSISDSNGRITDDIPTVLSPVHVRDLTEVQSLATAPKQERDPDVALKWQNLVQSERRDAGPLANAVVEPPFWGVRELLVTAVLVLILPVSLYLRRAKRWRGTHAKEVSEGLPPDRQMPESQRRLDEPSKERDALTGEDKNALLEQVTANHKAMELAWQDDRQQLQSTIEKLASQVSSRDDQIDVLRNELHAFEELKKASDSRLDSLQRVIDSLKATVDGLPGAMAERQEPSGDGRVGEEHTESSGQLEADNDNPFENQLREFDQRRSDGPNDVVKVKRSNGEYQWMTRQELATLNKRKWRERHGMQKGPDQDEMLDHETKVRDLLRHPFRTRGPGSDDE